MKNPNNVPAAVGLILLRGLTLAGAMALLSVPAISAPICGPGPNWVNTCDPNNPAIGSEDSFLSTFNVSFEWLAADFGPLMTGGIYDLSLYGPTTVTRSDPMGSGQIKTEIIKAQGEQLHPTLGALTLRIGTGNGVSTPTHGEVNQSQYPLVADSFFDVFFEFDSAVGTPIYNKPDDPLHLTAELTCLPPGQTNPDTGKNCVTLGGYFALSPLPYMYWNLGNGEELVARLVDDIAGNPPHHSVPEPVSVIMVGLGLAGLGLSRRKRAV